MKGENIMKKLPDVDVDFRELYRTLLAPIRSKLFVVAIEHGRKDEGAFLLSSGIRFGKPQRAQRTQRKQQLSVPSVSSVVNLLRITRVHPEEITKPREEVA